MVFGVLYKPKGKKNEEYCLFDIDIYMEQAKFQLDGWRSEIVIVCFPSGVAKYVFDNIHSEEELSQFQKDSEIVSSIRGTLHDTMHNVYLSRKEAHDRHNDEFLPKLEKIIQDFADKYGLEVKK